MSVKVGGIYDFRREMDGKTLRYEVIGFDPEHRMYAIRFEGNERSTVMGANSKMHRESIEVTK